MFREVRAVRISRRTARPHAFRYSGWRQPYMVLGIGSGFSCGFGFSRVVLHRCVHIAPDIGCAVAAGENCGPRAPSRVTER